MIHATIRTILLHSVGGERLSCQNDGLPEETPRFGLRVGEVETQVMQQIGSLLEIRAQLRPEASALPPRDGQPEHRFEPQRRAFQHLPTSSNGVIKLVLACCTAGSIRDDHDSGGLTPIAIPLARRERHACVDHRPNVRWLRRGAGEGAASPIWEMRWKRRDSLVVDAQSIEAKATRHSNFAHRKHQQNHFQNPNFRRLPGLLRKNAPRRR